MHGDTYTYPRTGMGLSDNQSSNLRARNRNDYLCYSSHSSSILRKVLRLPSQKGPALSSCAVCCVREAVALHRRFLESLLCAQETAQENEAAYELGRALGSVGAFVFQCVSEPSRGSALGT